MKTKQKIISAVGLVVFLGVGYLIYESVTFVTTDNVQIQAKTVMLASKVPGYIAKVNAEENQKVKAGDILVEIESRDYENTYKQISNEMEGLKARFTDAEKNFRRIESLFKQGAVSQQVFDNTQANYSEVRHKLDSVQAQVAQAQLNLDYTKIRAPTDGVIAKKSAEIGMLAPSGSPLIGFVSSDQRWLVANFKETDIKDIKIGNRVEIHVDAIPGRQFTGKVESLSAATGATFTLLPPDNATGNFTKVVQRVAVKIEFEGLKPEDIDLLQAGLSAEVKVRK